MSCTVEHAVNLDAVVNGTVEDDVAADREASQARSILVLLGSHSWIGCEELERLVDFSYQAIGCRHIVVSNVAPNRKKVGVCLGSTKNTSHQLCCSERVL